jgi:NAD(P)-dependent dehydrogenase (short-subunit alcohol dehydrogenase family)
VSTPDTRSVIVTGAGRGLGLAFARACHAAGDQVIATMRNPAGAAGLPKGIQIERLEVTKAEEHRALAQSLAGRPLDLLICNAALSPGSGGLREAPYTELDWFAGLMTNVAGPFLAVRALLPNLRVAVAPRVAIIACAGGTRARAAGDAYIHRASKAAAINLAANLAVELRPLGIAVGAFDPGPLASGGGEGNDPQDAAEALLERIAVLDLAGSGRFVTAEGLELAP